MNTTIRGVTIADHSYTIKFPPRSIVYSISKAKKGILEKVCIKLYTINVSETNFNKAIIIYKDNDNWTWTEDMLCTEADAVAYSIAYYEALLAQIDEQED